MEKNNALTTNDNFNIVPISADVADIINEELDGLGSLSFDRIKIPAGGATMFEVPGDDPENPECEKELVGVIVDHHAMNCYWKDAYSGENTAPDCVSMDGKTGVEKETGEIRNCAECPLNEYGSGENGSKACKNAHRIFLLRDNEVLPLMLSLPPTSLNNFKNYLLRSIVLKHIRCCDAVTKITLQKDKNAGGITYSKAVFSKVRELNAEEKESLVPTVSFVKSVSRQFVDFAEETDDLPFDGEE